MLCVCAVFAVARCTSVRPSVCLSVTLVHCIHTAEDIVNLLCRPGSRQFLTPAPVPNSKGNPSRGGTKYTGVRKKLRFSTEITVYLGNGTGEAHGCYGTLIRGRRW